ncbi:MAG: mannose-1-phosphate guanylyltransferase/mannose-6-phosphate isomerase [Candidatus Endolissoclinum sp. TMED37]|nr:MAG: mannose-1-phosphate guanylyltransferase/mannose-6-phosphate isomerase [Candidatus Endolissoclinum sp. TMED37]|tara:strand:+ start:77 stop:1513 length:1437 start_codon:yes stop_codon:yes gene_type:complete
MVNQTNITPVILAGGSGSRLWPLSRKSYPKQFLKLLGKKTLFQKAVSRVTFSNLIEFSSPIILTNNDYRFIIAQQLQSAGIDPGPIIIEPESKNTAPAILSACLLAYKKDKNAILLVTPSDHVIHELEKFHELISSATNYVKKNKMVTFGINPNRAETAYGYLELPNKVSGKISKLSNFIEKPNISDAKKMLKSKKFLWNSGIFMFKAEDMILEFKKNQKKMLKSVEESLAKANIDLGFIRLDHTPWKEVNNISIDYAIFEKATNLMVIPFSGYWSDLGDWNAILDYYNKNNKKNKIPKNVHSINCDNTLLLSDNSEQQIIGLGLNDIIAVAMDDAVLVTHKDSAQDVKNIVNLLNSKKIYQAESHLKDYRPWGWFKTISTTKQFKVKHIYVHPGASLSLQSHQYRSENWVVVRGKAEVIVGEQKKILSKGDSIYIPSGVMHRLKNSTKTPLMIIEVQTGTYFGEDDIKRYEDIYNRN